MGSWYVLEVAVTYMYKYIVPIPVNKVFCQSKKKLLKIFAGLWHVPHGV